MTMEIDRRDFLELVGLGGIVFASQLRGWAQAAQKAVGSGSGHDEFFFVKVVGGA